MPPTDTSFDAIWMVLILQIQCTRNVTEDHNKSDTQLVKFLNADPRAEWKVTIPGPQSSFIFYAAYNKTDTTTGTLQFVDGMTVFYGDSAKEDVMVEARSTFALPNRLTQIALYPHQNTYVSFERDT